MRAVVLVALMSIGCRLPVVVGSIECTSNAACAPPFSVCGVEARCVGGCAPGGCIGSATCNTTTGECEGGIFGTSCSSDPACDPPEVLCNAATGTCTASCVLTGTCPSGLTCDPSAGRCCDPGDPTCHGAADMSTGCQDDGDCGAPASVCQAGACVPGCATSGCTAPLACDSTTGHCTPTGCMRDSDCDANSSCTQSGTCRPLAQHTGDCQGGKVVSYTCAMSASATAFAACVGGAGVPSCPYCIDQSCLQPGLCTSNDDCSAGLNCTEGLCIVQSPQCPVVVSISAVVKGTYAVGREVCIHDKVVSVASGYDGAIEVRLGTSEYLYVDVLPMYQAAGVKLPTAGDEVTVHGVVRWDENHSDRELLPVDWIGP